MKEFNFLWEVTLIGSGNKDDLFEAIITADDDTKLIAQVTLAETARQIVSLHNAEILRSNDEKESVKK